MSKIAISGNASGTATYTIASPAGSTDRVLTLPDEAGTVLTSGGAIDVDASAPADSVAIDSSGNVGIGTSSPATALHVEGANGDLLTVKAASGSEFAMRVDGNEISFKADADNDEASSVMTFDVDGSEAMRIDSSGNLLVNTTSETGIASGNGSIQAGSFSNTGASAGIILENNGSVEYVLRASTTLSGSSRILCDFYNPNGRVGSIQTSGSSTSYVTSSDYRLKENVVDMTGAITRVKSLSPKRFNFIVDTDETTVDGFLAHEAQAVVPEAVTGTHDEVDDDGNAVYQGIDQSKLVPLLTGALQEAIAKIETLETTVADLQTRVTALESV